jgi:hypothetical protein
MRFIITVIFLVLPVLTWASERVALVIGISDYKTIPKLDNTVNDARGIADTLSSIGFQVTSVLEGSSKQLRDAVDEFSFRSEAADLALIYYAGHGVEVQGENFLIPVDADVKSNKDIQRQGLSLKELLASVERARKMRIVILDSCRDNPFGDGLDQAVLQATAETVEQTRGVGNRGLAKPSPDRGTLVAFAARDGERALDGSGSNSPFALALMESMKKPNLEISLMFRQVRDHVLENTQNQQEPHTYGSLSGTPFYIAGSSNKNSVVTHVNPSVAWSDIRPEQEPQLMALAEQGDTRSMVGLAYIRLNSEDNRYSPSEAASFLTQAAEAGSAEAQVELAQLYETGLGVPQDLTRALKLYNQSAEQNFPDALNDLGFIYFQGGLGIVRDPKKGLAYFEQAANLRQPQAMFNYAALIDDGEIEGKGPKDAANYLYQSLRSGSEQVYELLRNKANMFKIETRKELQSKLSEYAFYKGSIDGDFGTGTQRGIRAAYGLSE